MYEQIEASWIKQVYCIGGVLYLLCGVSAGLRDVRVTIPEAVSSGDTAVLHCRYDLEHDQLYSFKWYKNKHEFFRYIPKELPHTKIFPIPGVDVDMHRSGPGTLVLRSVSPSISDKYRCEVIADAPTYRTLVKSGFMHVVDVPRSLPELSVEKTRLAPGEILRARCISPPAYPPPNITWTLNGFKINSTLLVHIPERDLQNVLSNTTHIREFGHRKPTSTQNAEAIKGHKSESLNHDERIGRNKKENPGKSKKLEAGNKEKLVAVSNLVLSVEREMVRHNKLKLTCTCNVFHLYNKKVEEYIEIERPHTASILVMATGLNKGYQTKTHASGKLITAVITVLLVRCTLLRQ